MALFGFGKKEEGSVSGASASAPLPQTPESPKGTPIEQVLTLQKQGMSNHQIVQSLQQQGFSSQQVFDAMNQSSIKGGINADPASPMPPLEGNPTGGPPTGLPESPHGPPSPMPMGGMPLPFNQGMPPPPPMHGGPVAQGIEETVEAVVEEKWKEIGNTISKLNDWKDSTESKLNKLEQSMKDLKSDMDNLHKAIVGKIGEYDQNLLSVGTEIKAMEKVFSKVLPTFTENVNELSRVTKGLNKKK